MSSRSKKLGFEYIKEGIGLTAARFICSRCPEELYINKVAGKVPEIIANLARNKGWVCSPHTVRTVLGQR